MATHTVRITLDTASIANAIREVEQYRDDLVNFINELVRRLTEDGMRVAAVNVQRLGALDTGELTDSFVGVYNDATHIGILRSDAYYAVFVEYGTGVVGMGSPYTGPFMPGSVTVKGNTYSAYDQNGHGDAGWYYISDRDGHRHWTKGQPSRPFFYQTYLELVRMAEQAFNNVNI